MIINGQYMLNFIDGPKAVSDGDVFFNSLTGELFLFCDEWLKLC